MVLKASSKKINNFCIMLQSKNRFFILKIKPHCRNEWISGMLFLYTTFELRYQNQNLLWQNLTVEMHTTTEIVHQLIIRIYYEHSM